MPSWRDTVTGQAQADLDGLTDAVVDFALASIGAHGEFLPFALAVSVDGEREVIAPNYPTSAQLTVVEQVAAHWRALAEVKNNVRAAAVALNVTLPERNRDGIEISVEHREGVAIGLIFPYTIDANGTVELEVPSAHTVDARLWTP